MHLAHSFLSPDLVAHFIAPRSSDDGGLQVGPRQTLLLCAGGKAFYPPALRSLAHPSPFSLHCLHFGQMPWCVSQPQGAVAIAGAAVQWLRDALGIISTPAEVETLVSDV